MAERERMKPLESTNKTSCSISERISFFNPSAVKVRKSESVQCLLYSKKVERKAIL